MYAYIVLKYQKVEGFLYLFLRKVEQRYCYLQANLEKVTSAGKVLGGLLTAQERLHYDKND